MTPNLSGWDVLATLLICATVSGGLWLGTRCTILVVERICDTLDHVWETIGEISWRK